MGRVLHAVGAFSAHRRWTVVLIWIALIAGVGASAVALKGPTDDSFSIPGTASVATYERLGQAFPSSGGASGEIVVAAPAGHTLAEPAYTDAISTAVAGVRGLKGVAAASDPFAARGVSQDGSVAFISVNYAAAAADLPPTTLDSARAAAAPMTDAGLQVEFAGTAYVQPNPPGGSGEGVGAIVAIIVLLIALRALVAAMLPFVTGIAAVAVGVGGVTALTGFVSLPSTATVLALMLGLAVGIDYSLFILARHRTQLLSGMSVRESIARATGTAGAAVVFAGATVIVALLALVVANIPFLTAMGNAAAVTVALAVMAALTLLPAVLSFAGVKVLPRKLRRELANPSQRRAILEAEPSRNRWVSFVTRRPATVLIAGVVALGVIAAPALDMRLGLPTDQSQPQGSTARKAYDLLAQGFGPGFNGPIVVLGETGNSATGQADIAAFSAAVSGLDNVAVVTPATPNAAGTAYVMQVIPTTGPDAVQTENLVHDIRALATTGDMTFSVTGTTAIRIDVSEGIARALPGYLAIVVGLALVLLLIVFRSVLIPLKALLGFLLTLAATTGAVVAVFQWGWLASVFQVSYTGPIVAFLPIIGIGITFGLAMDYEVFLVSRMREEHLAGAEPKDAIVVGYSHSARVVTAAALIMSSVFMGFLLDHDVVIKSIGFALAFAVLIDAFVVRMTLVPAAMALMGKAAWWLPTWLNRVVPEIHLEGDPEDRTEIDAGEPELERAAV